ncbi:UNVERIFIED_CONTAM: hypothetical protein GTU68_026392 [Idotea baltica]|nr:hypothetical protein [Idotea baltica]
MGQKVHPIGMRLGYVKEWYSVWYSNCVEYQKCFLFDFSLRNYIREQLASLYFSYIIIEHFSQIVKVCINVSRTTLIFKGRNKSLEEFQEELKKKFRLDIILKLKLIKKPEINSFFIASFVKHQLEKRVSFRKIIKRALTTAVKFGIKGIKITLSGRLGGAEIARTEWVKEGRIPLHTFRADIDYSTLEAFTLYGVIGIKIWVFKGEIF